MTRAEKTYLFDRLIEAGLASPLYTSGAGGSELHFRCPIRDHEHDRDRKTAFGINLDKLTWYCFKCGRGGGAFQLAAAVIGSNDAARGMLKVIRQRMGDLGVTLKLRKRDRFIEQRREAEAAQPEILADQSIFQLDAMRAYNQLIWEMKSFSGVENHLVAWAGREWMGFPTLCGTSWKLWGVDNSGRIRRDPGKRSIQKRNVGPVSLVASYALRDALAKGTRVDVLYDVEGEGDLLCAIEHDLDPVLTSTGGAGTTQGHERCRELLVRLDIGKVQIVRDRDEAGRHGTKLTAAFWTSLGVPCQIIELPEEVGDGGDLRDYFAWLGGAGSTRERNR